MYVPTFYAPLCRSKQIIHVRTNATLKHLMDQYTVSFKFTEYHMPLIKFTTLH